ncbi:MAG: HNH endonuclease signature motif containing protein [Candidatus Omnitrophota bacterium]
MNKEQLKEIFDKTRGHCHFCGDKLAFNKYGYKKNSKTMGIWEADHIIQKGKGGIDSADNYLPACLYCNRLRWDRRGRDMRELILFGLIAKEEIKKNSEIGNILLKLKKKRLKANLRRRKNE